MGVHPVQLLEILVNTIIIFVEPKIHYESSKEYYNNVAVFSSLNVAGKHIRETIRSTDGNTIWLYVCHLGKLWPDLHNHRVMH